MSLLKRIDAACARGEGWLTVATLLLMVLVAGFQAAVRNVTVRLDISCANALLTDMEWADSLLRKSTLWLAFLGASLATYHRKHIGIDVLLMLSPKRPKYIMLAVGSLLSGIVTIGLAYSYGAAVAINLGERPLEYEMIADDGYIHVCDGTPEQIAQLSDFDRPTSFCMTRSLFHVVGLEAETPGAIFQLIVPIMFVVIALRLLGQGVEYAKILAGGPEAIAKAEAEEEARKLETEASIRPPAADGSG